MGTKNRSTEFIGQVFERLTVLGRAYKGDRPAWRCRCACGKETVVRGYNLRSGATKSCGCYIADMARAARKAGPPLNPLGRPGKKTPTPGKVREPRYREKTVYWTVPEGIGESLMDCTDLEMIRAWGIFTPTELTRLENGVVVEKPVMGIETKFIVADNQKQAARGMQAPYRRLGS